jgi:hypothetical protein
MTKFDTNSKERTGTEPETDGGIIVAGDEGEVLDDDPYTEHREPPAQGGERYVRCEACGRELLCELGGRDALLHAPECTHG